MKNLLVLLAILFSNTALAEEKKEDDKPKTKRVCVKKVDPATKAEKEVCRTIKIHKKLEGTKVPEKK